MGKPQTSPLQEHDQLSISALRALVSAVTNVEIEDEQREAGRAQSATSHRVQELEGALGVQLFHRAETGVLNVGAKLTIEGALLVDAARSVLWELDATLLNIASISALRATNEAPASITSHSQFPKVASH
jgi:DNA-binding transcriptional LysR family regulator